MLQITNERELKQLYDILIFQHVIKIYVKVISYINLSRAKWRGFHALQPVLSSIYIWAKKLYFSLGASSRTICRINQFKGTDKSSERICY